jgi:predicted DNA-binding transcriptional regulator AlpA
VKPPTHDELVERTALAAADLVRAFGALLAAPAQTNEPARPLRREELARALGVGVATVDRAVREGMTSTGRGRMRRFDLEACRAWMASRSTTSGTSRPAVDREAAVVAQRNGLRVVRGTSGT